MSGSRHWGVSAARRARPAPSVPTASASIEATNAPSVAPYSRLGFELVGTAREVGHKFGRWLDLTLMRLAPSVPAG